MKRGSRGARVAASAGVEETRGRKVEVEMRDLEDAATRSMIRESLSSSSGQMSGQCVKPK